MRDTVCIKTLSTRAEAELAKGVLEAAGIPALVTVDDAGGMRPEIAFTTGGAKVWVERGHAEAAAELLGTKEPPELAARRSVLTAQFRGCMLPAVLGALLLVVGAFLGNYVASWLGSILIAIATVLVVVALVRGARAA